MEELHRISQILIERETIDKDQFERLLAGEDEASVFAEDDAEGGARREAGRAGAAPLRSRGRSRSRARPMQPPEPEGV